MERREFLAAGGVVIADFGLRIADWTPPMSAPTNPQSAIANPQSPQEPSLSTEVFARRLDRARAELKARGLQCLIATPGTNYEYLTGYNPGRSERLIALILPLEGAPAVVCPAFETERIKRHSAVADARGWEEQDDPYDRVRDTVRRLAPRAGTVALESSTRDQTAPRLAAARGRAAGLEVRGRGTRDRAAPHREGPRGGRPDPPSHRDHAGRHDRDVRTARRGDDRARRGAALVARDATARRRRRRPGAVRSVQRATPRWPRRGRARAGNRGADRLRLPRRRVRVGHHPHGLVRRQSDRRVSQGVQRGARRPKRRHRAGTVRHAVPGHGPRRAPGDQRGGLRIVLHPPPGARARHGWPRAALSGGRQRAATRARDGVHRRAGDLSAREVRGQNRRRLRHDGEGR